MRFLILGVYYSPNLGDPVICDSVAARLAVHFPDAEIVIRDLLGRTGFPPVTQPDLDQIDYYRRRAALRHFVSRYTPWDKEKGHELQRIAGSRAFIRALCAQPWDLVIFAGGQLFQDGFSLFLEDFVRQLNERNIPVLFNACGTGPAWSPYVRKKLTAALTAPCVKLISTRDNEDLIRSHYLRGADLPVISVTDPALWSASVYGTQKQASDTIGLGIMYATSVNMKQEQAFWLKLIRFLEEKQVKWQFFVNGTDLDMAYARHILSLLPPELRARSGMLAEAPRTPGALMETVARYKSIISFRLHSHVIAASLGIPGVAIYWDEKLTFFYKKLGCPERCKTIHSSPQEIWDALQAAERQGCPEDLILRQREESEAILVDAIRRVLEGRAQ